MPLDINLLLKGVTQMGFVVWQIFTEKWLQRAERTQRCLDDGDRFISLWIAFNGWMKGEFGESQSDRDLIAKVKNSLAFKDIFVKLKNDSMEFRQNLRELSNYSVLDMRHMDDENRYKRYDGSFKSLLEVIYQVRCNLFHGRKDVDEDRKDFELVSLSYNILLPLFKEYLKAQGGRNEAVWSKPNPGAARSEK